MEDNIQKTESFEERYSRLRSWYLARLRKSAMEQSQINELTPLALIHRDQRLVEQLTAQKRAEPVAQQAPVRRLPVLACAGLFALWLIMTIGLLAGQDPLQIMLTVFRLTLGVLIFDTSDQSLSILPPYVVAALCAAFFAIPPVTILLFKGSS